MPHTYFRSSLWVSLCFAKADALPNTLLQTYEMIETKSNESSFIGIIQQFIES